MKDLEAERERVRERERERKREKALNSKSQIKFLKANS